MKLYNERMRDYMCVSIKK